LFIPAGALNSGGNFFHYMAAADYSAGYIAMKQYTYVRGKLRFLVLLYEMATGGWLRRLKRTTWGNCAPARLPA